uniref:Transcription initiation factor TFIID subunit 12 n=1 Tax=Aceria tosichella TaxID=561515 RepID=A0A6G1SBA2_9ACAR
MSEPSIPPPIEPKRLQDLVNEVDPDEQLDEDVEEVLLNIGEDFIDAVVSSACEIAKHRNSNTLEVGDVRLCLERKYKIWIPGFGGESRPTPKRFTSEAHKQRMALINKQQDNKSTDDANKKK